MHPLFHFPSTVYATMASPRFSSVGYDVSLSAPLPRSRRMLHAPNDRAPHLVPVYTLVQLLVHQADDRHIVAPHNIKPVLDLARRLVVVRRADDALVGLPEDLAAARQSAQCLASSRPPSVSRTRAAPGGRGQGRERGEGGGASIPGSSSGRRTAVCRSACVSRTSGPPPSLPGCQNVLL